MNQLPDEIHSIENLISPNIGLMVQVKHRDNKDDNCLSWWALSFNLRIEIAIKTGLLYMVCPLMMAYHTKNLLYPRALTCMHLYLKMHLVFENTCMHLYSNTKIISSKRHALIFEHEITLIIKKLQIFLHKKINRLSCLFCSVNYRTYNCINTPSIDR